MQNTPEKNIIICRTTIWPERSIHSLSGTFFFSLDNHFLTRIRFTDPFFLCPSSCVQVHLSLSLSHSNHRASQNVNARKAFLAVGLRYKVFTRRLKLPTKFESEWVTSIVKLWTLLVDDSSGYMSCFIQHLNLTVAKKTPTSMQERTHKHSLIWTELRLERKGNPDMSFI